MRSRKDMIKERKQKCRSLINSHISNNKAGNVYKAFPCFIILKIFGAEPEK